MRFRGQNPVYRYGNYERGYEGTEEATYGGVVTKTSILLGIIAIVALYFANTLNFTSATMPSYIIPVLIGAPILALIMVIATHVSPRIAPVTSIIYAVCEGLFLGFISALYAALYGGAIVQMALVGTFGVLGAMLFLYATGAIRVGNFFRKLMMSMLFGVVFASVILLIISFTGSFETFYTLYIGIVAISVVLSSLFLLMDFDRISRYVQDGAPKSTEWSLSLGLVVTIVWLYIELLRLLAILTNRRN